MRVIESFRKGEYEYRSTKAALIAKVAPREAAISSDRPNPGAGACASRNIID
jgi:hypothetical protein